MRLALDSCRDCLQLEYAAQQPQGRIRPLRPAGGRVWAGVWFKARRAAHHLLTLGGRNGLVAVDAGPLGGAVCHAASAALGRARVQKDGFSVAFGMRRVAQPCVDELCGGEDGCGETTGGGESVKLPRS
jgi:hypothetical protein